MYIYIYASILFGLKELNDIDIANGTFYLTKDILQKKQWNQRNYLHVNHIYITTFLGTSNFPLI